MSQRVQVARSQEAVNDKLHMLEMHQKETHDSLLQMEKTASSMYQVWIQLLSLQFHCGHVRQALQTAIGLPCTDTADA